jgi:hypothetical protein
MDKSYLKIFKRDWTYGILLFIGFLIYFYIMKSTELYTEFNLRIFNVVIHALLIYLAIRSYYKEHPNTQINYLDGAFAGIRPGLVGVFLFGLFQVVYLHIDTELMSAVENNAMAGTFMNPYTAAAVVLFEGVAVTLVLSYILMRIVDSQHNESYPRD